MNFFTLKKYDGTKKGIQISKLMAVLDKNPTLEVYVRKNHQGW